ALISKRSTLKSLESRLAARLGSISRSSTEASEYGSQDSAHTCTQVDSAPQGQTPREGVRSASSEPQACPAHHAPFSPPRSHAPFSRSCCLPICERRSRGDSVDPGCGRGWYPGPHVSGGFWRFLPRYVSQSGSVGPHHRGLRRV